VISYFYALFNFKIEYNDSSGLTEQSTTLI
jgi:hypothetical protein